ncbi:hypothetical protein BCR42DRAFT_406712, partial [Absidia repens]
MVKEDKGNEIELILTTSFYLIEFGKLRVLFIKIKTHIFMAKNMRLNQHQRKDILNFPI